MTRSNKMDWPTAGDRLIAWGPDFQNNASIAQYYPDTSTSRLHGFLRATEVLAEKIAQSHSDLDILIYPLLFLIRHHIELSLKEIIQDKLFLEQRRGLPPTHHDLMKLWLEVIDVMKSRWEDDAMRNAAVPFESLLKDLYELDPHASSFRYAFNKKGETNLKGTTHINIRHLYEMIERMNFFLSACKWITEREIDYRNETMRDYDNS